MLHSRSEDLANQAGTIPKLEKGPFLALLETHKKSETLEIAHRRTRGPTSFWHQLTV